MKKILKASLILSAVLFCGCMFAAVIPVTSTGDSGSGTLRDAISKAQSGDTIKFDQDVNTITLTQGTIPITNSITIDGNGQTITTTANDRVFYIFTTTGTTTFKNLTIDGGNTSFNGAGILLQSGNLVLDHVTVQDGTAANGGGIYVGGSSYSSLLTLQNNTVITNNQATNSGGGIYVTVNGTINVNDSSVNNNSASSYGGGIFSVGTTNVSNQSQVNDNTSTSCGGGIYVDNGTVTINYDSTNSHNTAHQSGGGIYVNNGVLYGISFYSKSNHADCNGGGICVDTNGQAALSNAVISNNTAQNGGGVFTIGNVVIDKTTYVTSNTADIDTNGKGGGICVEGGKLTLNNALVGKDNSIANTGPNKALVGAGIYVENGTVNIKDNSRISGNIAGDCTLTGAGGGIYVYTGTVTVDNSIVGQVGNIGAPNLALNGGGIGVDGGTLTIRNNSQVSQNTATALGGGLYITTSTDPATVNFNGSTNSPYNAPSINGNTAAWGAGVYVEKGSTFKASYSYISNNNCMGSHNGDERGGGICSLAGKVDLDNVNVDKNTCNLYHGNGGGIMNEGGTLTISSSTISNNSAYQEGGGIYNTQYNTPDNCTITASTIYGNSADYGSGICNDNSASPTFVYGTTIAENIDNSPDNTAAVYCYHNSRMYLIGCLLKNSDADVKVENHHIFDLYAGDHATVTIWYSCFGCWECDNSNVSSKPDNMTGRTSTNLLYDALDRNPNVRLTLHGFTSTYDFKPDNYANDPKYTTFFCDIDNSKYQEFIIYYDNSDGTYTPKVYYFNEKGTLKQAGYPRSTTNYNIPDQIGGRLVNDPTIDTTLNRIYGASAVKYYGWTDSE